MGTQVFTKIQKKNLQVASTEIIVSAMNIFRLFMIFRMSGVFIIAKPMAATEIDIPTLVRSATSFNTIWENDVKILTQ